MVITTAAVLAGLFLGAVLGWLLLRRRVEVWTRRWSQRWVEEETAALRDDAAARSRAVLRGRISEQLAPLSGDFPFDPGDARFIGSPVDFVVFDGYRDVQEGTADSLRGIVFVDVKTGSSSLSTVQRRVRDCVLAGRVSWRVLGHVPTAHRG